MKTFITLILLTISLPAFAELFISSDATNGEWCEVRKNDGTLIGEFETDADTRCKIPLSQVMTYDNIQVRSCISGLEFPHDDICSEWTWFVLWPYADLDNDGKITLFDLRLVWQQWHCQGSNQTGCD